MKTKENIRWAALQPLTGGMYLGAEKAIGHPAEFILSFPGIGDAHYNKKGEFTSCGNEYHLMKYLEKKNRLPNYMVFDKNMFEDGDTNVTLKPSQWTQHEIYQSDFEKIDIVVGVPVCSGLSAATIAKSETKDTRNCNMIWLTKYALEKIQPLVYIFENAPRLFTSAGSDVRSQLNEIARKNHYSVLYYKTDTFLHNNAQKRLRTFVVFMKWRYDSPCMPAKFDFESNTVPLEEMFSRALSTSTQQFSPEIKETEKIQLKYLEHLAGKDWQKTIGRYPDVYFKNNIHMLDDFMQFISTQCDEFKQEYKDKLTSYLLHCKEKLNAGKNFYSAFIGRPGENFIDAVMFKVINVMMHPNENRKISVREYLTFMGHPQDFEMQGTDKMEYLAQIGQNVPVDTAAFIVGQAAKIVMKWYNTEIYRGDDVHKQNVMFIDNIKHTITYD